MVSSALQLQFAFIISKFLEVKVISFLSHEMEKVPLFSCLIAWTMDFVGLRMYGYPIVEGPMMPSK